jgi:hypothetical protein
LSLICDLACRTIEGFDGLTRLAPQIVPLINILMMDVVMSWDSRPVSLLLLLNYCSLG